MGARETALNALMACRKDGAWSNGILKEYTQREIAGKLGISRSYVSRIEKRALEKLKQALEQ